MTDYESLLQEGAAPATPAPPPMATPSYEGLLTAPSKATAISNLQAQPDQAAQAVKIGKQVGAPGAVVEGDLDGWKAMQAQDDAARRFDANPALGAYVASDPMAAKVSADDWKPLDNLTAKPAMTLADAVPPHVVGESYPEITKGYEAQRLGEYSFAQMLGIKDIPGVGNVEAAIQAIETKQKTYSDPTSLFQKYSNEFQNFIGSLGAAIASPTGIAGGAAGAGLGAAAASAVGGPVGALGGAVIGGGKGLGAGVATDFAISSAGSLYRQLSNLQDKNGNPISEDVKYTVSIGAGILSGLIMAAGGTIMKGAIDPLMEKGAQSVASKIAINLATDRVAAASIAKGASTIASSGLQGGIINASLQFAQGVGEQIAKAWSGDFPTVFNDPVERGKFIDTMTDAFKSGALLFGGLHLGAIGLGKMTDAVHAANATEGQSALDQMMQQRADSNTFQRSPEMFSKAMRPVLGDGQAHIPAELVQEHRDAFGFVPDLDKQIAEGLPVGGDVSMPVADLVAHLDDETYGKVRDHVRLGEVSPAEAEEITKNPLERREETEAASGEVIPATEAAPGEAQGEGEAQAEPRAPDPIDYAALAEHAEVAQPMIAERRAMWLDSLFKTAKDLGLSKVDFARYSQKLQDLQAAITKGVFDAAHKLIGQTQTKEWIENRKAMQAETETDLRQEPLYMADQELRGSKGPTRVKLDLKAANDIFNSQGEGGYNLRDLLSKDMFETDGLHPDEAAELFGYRSGKDMLNDLVSLERQRRDAGETPGVHFARQVKELTDERMKAKYGDLDNNILKAAIELALETKQIDVLHEEIKDLAERIGERPLELEDIKGDVRDSFESMDASKARDYAGFRRLVGKAGAAAERALLAGDFLKAFKAKQMQLRSFLLAKEAVAFDNTYRALARTLKRFAKEPRPESIAPEWNDRIHEMMKQAGLESAMHPQTLADALNGVKVDDFVREQRNEGKLVVDPTVQNKPFDKYTVSELRDFKAGLDSFVHNGRQDMIVERAGKEMLRQTAVAEAVENLKSIGDSWRATDKSKLTGLTNILRWIDSRLLIMERFLDWIDKNDPNGVMNNWVVRPLVEARSWKDDKLTELSGHFKAITEVLGGKKEAKAWTKSLSEDMPNTLLRDRDGLMKINREGMLAIALNTGSESNHHVLTKGMNWDPKDVEQFLHENMTKQDWAYVKSIWDIFRTIWPDVQRVTRKLSGVAADPVQERTLNTKFGQVQGGYYPLIEDPISALNKSRFTTDDLFQTQRFNPLPNPRSTRTRTGVVYPIDLTVSQMPSRIMEMIHNLAFREAIITARKILGDSKVRSATTDAYGRQYTEQFDPWLKYIASNGGYTDDSGSNWLIRKGRVNAQMMMIGFNPGTAVVHGTSAFANSVAEAGTGNYLRALTQFTKSPEAGVSMWEWIKQNSPEIRNRAKNFEKDVRYALDKSFGKDNLQAKLLYWSMSMVRMSDQMSTGPLWLATLNKTLAEGGQFDDAVYAADKSVRAAHGSSGITDLSAVRRDPGVLSMFTMFYSYFNHNYNQIREMGRAMSEGDFSKVLARSVGYLVVPAAIHAAVRQEKEKNESWGSYAARALTTQLAGTIPGLRDIAYASVESKSGEVGQLPIMRAMQGFADLATNAGRAVEMRELKKNWVKKTLDALGYGLGYGTNLTSKSGQFLWDLHTGQQRADSLYAFAKGLTTGKSK